MRRIEELLAIVSPKVTLDHYWEVFDVIEWRFYVSNNFLSENDQAREKKGFTISGIKNYILNESSEGYASPYYKRLCSRSLVIVEELLNELVNSELLVKHNDILWKSEEFSDFFQIVKKKIKVSAKRIVSWAVWYLYCKGTASFSISEVLNELSYSDEDYVNEIPYLWVYKDKNWKKLLEKHKDNWLLLEKPRFPQKILLLDIQDRLHAAISELSKSGNELRTKEIVSKVRELEISSLETFLKRIGLEYDKGKWKINEVTLEKIANIINEIVAKEWPFFGEMGIRSPYFKLLGRQTRYLYVDIPNGAIDTFVNKLGEITEEYNGDQDKIYEKSIDLANDFNKDFKKEIGDWLHFEIYRGPFASKPFGLKIIKRWKKFTKFLEIFSKKETSLEDKYQYLLACRASSLKFIIKDNFNILDDLEETQEDIKELCEIEINQTRKIIEDFVNRLISVKNQLYKISKRKTVFRDPSTLLYLPEMISTLQAIVNLVENGTIPACYREMRKILENLCWMMFEDFLYFKTSTLKSRGDSETVPPNPYGYVSRNWYDWSIQEGFTVKNVKEIKNKMEFLIEQIHSYGKIKDYRWNKKQIEEALFKGLSYPLFMLLMGKKMEVAKKFNEFVPKHEVKPLLAFATEDLKGVIKQLGRLKLSQTDEKLIEVLIQIIESKISSEEIVPPYPSNEFVLGFVAKTFSNKLLNKEYSEYSHFVHSYHTSWHIFPFSSVLEFKIFEYELQKFAKNIQQLIDAYLNELFA
nr:hypothetical protein [Candidatus Freyarchaeota archaeon]